ncbi:hypothetical protein HaLaN_00532 [Haematococcus lacustris]|uniref:F-box domain-containing protein n=1 Tax=Haematococcus lacustris TaxID=44745 RepID=A0A699YDT1_HAELA|nr:hypothetical protein HaLaN_00532 [Haematococcus lacustris]
MLSDTLQRFPGIGSTVYQHLDANSRRAMRLVCKQLRAAINDAVSGLGIASINRDDPDEVLQRLARTSLRPSKLYLWNYSSSQTTLFLAALAARELVPVLHEVQHLTMYSIMPLSAALVISLTMPQLRSLDVNCHMDVTACRAWQRLPHLSSLKLALTPASGAAAATPPLKGLEDITSLRSLDLTYSHDMVDEGSLAACTQLTALIFVECFPALTQLTQLQQLEYVKDLSSDSLPLLATLPQLVNLSLLTCPLHSSSQLSRFLFQHLISLKVESIHSRDLAALDCPQLQTLTVRQLLVDCAASLRACASGILQHCSSIYKLFTYNHGQEFKAAAAGAEVRQLGPPPSASVLLEALAPWQPRSGKAIERLGLWHLPDVTREALEWLPVLSPAAWGAELCGHPPDTADVPGPHLLTCVSNGAAAAGSQGTTGCLTSSSCPKHDEQGRCGFTKELHILHDELDRTPTICRNCDLAERQHTGPVQHQQSQQGAPLLLQPKSCPCPGPPPHPRIHHQQ